MTNIGFLEESEGHKSNGRLIADIIICVVLALCGYMLYAVINIAIVNKSVGDLVAGAAAVGVMFTTVGGAALFYLFNHKKEESEAKLDQIDPRVVNITQV